MSSERLHQQPISARHAFALAFDLALRRDALHSFFVPLLIRAPWSLTAAILPPLTATDRPAQVLGITSAAMVGDFIAMLVIGSMLRFRARSVFNTPAGTRPMPALDCYALGLARLPWLLVTEVLRNVAVSLGGIILVLPGVFLGFKLSMATEATVLRGEGPTAAFQRSWRLSHRRFERWLEMIAMSVLIVLAIWFVVTMLYVIFPGPGVNTWAAIAWLIVAAFVPVIQYAWTFFYLRLEELDTPLVEVGPVYAGTPEGLEPAGTAAGRGSEFGAEAEVAAVEAYAPPGNGAPPRLTLVEPRRSSGEPSA